MGFTAGVLSRTRLCIALFVTVLGTAWIGPAAADAATYYLSGSGSNANAGTLGSPWRTMGKAEENVKAGDTVYLREGTYGLEKAETRTELTKAGTAGSSISWLAYPGDPAPVFRGAVKVSGAYNRLSGIDFEGPSGKIGSEAQEVLIWIAANGVRVDHGEVHGGKAHAGIYVSTAPEFTIDHDYIHDNGVTANLDHGVYVGTKSSGSIYDNLITDNFAYGVQVYEDATEVTVNHNTIVGNGRGGVVVGADVEAKLSPSHILVANNIVDDNTAYGINAFELKGTVGNEARDNLIYPSAQNIEGEGMTFTGTTVADPLFMSPTNFHLQSGSPAIGAAGAPTVTDDIEGNLRGEPSDLGAYEHVAPQPELRAASSATAEASTSLVLPKPAGTATGDVLIAQVVNRGNSAITAPSGWTLIRDTPKGTAERMATFYKVAGASEPTSYTFTSTNAFGKAGGVADWVHVDASSPIVESSGASGTGTTATAGSVTTVAGSPLMLVVGINDQTTVTQPAGFSEQWDTNSKGTYKATAESSYAIQAIAGASGSKSATSGSAGGGWEAQLIALRPQ
jgi:hypothetical protein